jgi:hypothetical protein
MTETAHPDRADTESRSTVRELDHRVRNNYAALMSLVDLTRMSATSVPDFASTMTRHIQAMAIAHELLSRADFRSLALRDLAVALQRGAVLDSMAISGADVRISGRQAVALALILQQMFASFSKVHHPSALRIDWRWIEERERQLQITCSGIDAIPQNARSLIEGLTRSELRGAVRFGHESTLIASLDPAS